MTITTEAVRAVAPEQKNETAAICADCRRLAFDVNDTARCTVNYEECRVVNFSGKCRWFDKKEAE